MLAGLLAISLLAPLQETVPHPRSLLGFEPATTGHLMTYEQSALCFRAMAEKSPRMQIQVIGKSSEGRDILMALIGSPQNLADLSRITKDLSQVADPRTLTEAGEKRIVAETPALAFVSLSMHATEVGGSQYGPVLAWELLTREDPEARRLRDRVVIAMLPSTNPDGMTMVARWYRRRKAAKKPSARLPWLYQRYAGHDNNRDWYMQNLPETRAITRQLYEHLYPVALLDMHQMGSRGPRYFVPPYANPVNPNLDPILTRALNLLGSRMSHDMSIQGCKGVVSSTTFDNWWIGGNRNVPFRHNVLGILTECASANLADPIHKAQDKLTGMGVGLPKNAIQENFPDPWPGGRWGMEEITRYNRAAAWSFLLDISRHRGEYLARKILLGRRAIQAGKQQAQKGWLIARQGPRSDRLVATLQAQGIEVRQLTRGLAAKGGRPAYPKGSFYVPMDQPYRAMAKDLLEVQHYPELLDAPGGKVIRPYDQAGWTLPLMFRVQASPYEESRELSLRVLARQPLPPVPSPRGRTGKRSARLGLFRSTTPSMDEGWTRYILDQAKLDYSSVAHKRIRKGRLFKDYRVLAFASMSGSNIDKGQSSKTQLEEFAGGIGEPGRKALLAFLERGGRIVAWGRSVDYFLDLVEAKGLNVLAGKARKGFSCPGSLLMVEKTKRGKGSSLLGSYEDRFAVYQKDAVALEGKGLEVLLRYADDPFASGYLQGKEKIAGKAALARYKHGRGELILFGFRPQNRGQTLGTIDLLLETLGD